MSPDRPRLRSAEVLDVLAQKPYEPQTTRDIADALGIARDDERGNNNLSVLLTRLFQRGELERPTGGTGYYKLAGKLSFGEVAHRLREAPLLLHGVQARAGPEAVRMSEARAGDSVPLWSWLPADTRAGAGNKAERRMGLGPGRTLTFHRHANGLDVSFGVTDNPFQPIEFSGACHTLAGLTGIPIEHWVLVNVGVNKDLADLKLSGFSEVQLTLGDMHDAVVRIYEHRGLGVRVEVHKGGVIALPEALAIVTGQGHLPFQTRLDRLESVLKDLASAVGQGGIAERAPKHGDFCP